MLTMKEATEIALRHGLTLTDATALRHADTLQDAEESAAAFTKTPQLTADDVKALTPEQIVAAKDEGRLDDLLSGGAQ